MAPTVATNTRASSSEPMAMKPYQTRRAQTGGCPDGFQERCHHLAAIQAACINVHFPRF